MLAKSFFNSSRRIPPQWLHYFPIILEKSRNCGAFGLHDRLQLLFLGFIISTSTAFANPTTLNLYRPFAQSSKHPPITIVTQTTGQCNKQSSRVVREDAWRCVSREGFVYDPCFSKRFSTDLIVICPQSPWSDQGVQLTLTAPLNEKNQTPLDMSKTLPWAIELKDGKRCLSSESQQPIEDLPTHYQCNEHTVLLGDAHRCSPTWTILKYDSAGLSTAEIVTAWF
jgi:hypothetical protein